MEDGHQRLADLLQFALQVEDFGVARFQFGEVQGRTDVGGAPTLTARGVGLLGRSVH